MPQEPRLVTVETREGPRLLPCMIDRVPRSRHVRIQVDAERRVHLRIPWRMAEREAMAFLSRHGDWVLAALERTPKPQSLESYLRRHPRVSADGRWWPLALIARPQEHGWRFAREGDAVELTHPPDAARSHVLQQTLRAFAGDVLPHRVARLARGTGLDPSRVTVRDQRSRWGSCSGHDTISLNWRLVLLSPKLHDYVILHELAHLRHLDHSGDFWSFLIQLDPRAREHDARLSKCSQTLMALGR